jgi:hypothetical protein
MKKENKRNLLITPLCTLILVISPGCSNLYEEQIKAMKEKCEKELYALRGKRIKPETRLLFGGQDISKQVEDTTLVTLLSKEIAEKEYECSKL